MHAAHRVADRCLRIENNGIAPSGCSYMVRCRAAVTHRSLGMLLALLSTNKFSQPSI